MRWIGSSDQAKARVWRQLAKQVDYGAEFSRLEKEAKAVKESNDKSSRVERKLEELRREWSAFRRQKIFAETGVTVI